MADTHGDLLNGIWELTTKLSDEALKAAENKATELGFDLNKGVVNFAETRINLIYSRDLLSDAIQNKKLIQLPVTIQTELKATLENIVSSVTSLTNGTDDIVIFSDRVEKLNLALWQYGFHNLSNQLLGFQTKMNQLKSQELAIESLLQKLRATSAIGEAAQEALNATQASSSRVGTLIEEVEASKQRISALSGEALEDRQKTGASLASIQQAHEDASRLLSTITTANGQSVTLTEQISQLFASIGQKNTQLTASIQEIETANQTNQATAANLISKVTEDARALLEGQKESVNVLTKKLEDKAAAIAGESQATIDTFKVNAGTQLTQTIQTGIGDLKKAEDAWGTAAQELLADKTEELKVLTAHLNDLEGQIKDQIEKAVGYSLFGAFQKRQESIVTSKTFWQNALFACVLAGVGLGVYFIWAFSHAVTFNYAYLVKLTLSLPVIYAISFCSIQYGKERRLEEEYAFKAGISVSLNPYQELVGKLVDLKVPEERAKYTDFIITSITSVFSSPTDKVYETVSVTTDLSSLEKAGKQLRSILEPFLKILNHK